MAWHLVRAAFPFKHQGIVFGVTIFDQMEFLGEVSRSWYMEQMVTNFPPPFSALLCDRT